MPILSLGWKRSSTCMSVLMHTSGRWSVWVRSPYSSSSAKSVSRFLSLFECFKPNEIRRLAGRLEIHHMPKHGIWLNTAEIKLNVLNRQCLNRRIESLAKLQREICAWENKWNKKPTLIHWLFNKEKARVKLVSLYPDLSK